MITAKEAARIIEHERPNEKIVGCLEFDDFYAFDMMDKSWSDDTLYGGALGTVNKKTGEIGAFSPPDDFDAFKRAKDIDLSELRD